MRLLCIIAAIFLLLCSCSPILAKAPAPAEDVILSMCSAEGELPAGKVYTMEKAANSPDTHLSAELLNILYGEVFSTYFVGEVPMIEDGAVFLPCSASAVEFAVFLCRDGDTCRSVAKNMLSRLDTVRRFWRGTDMESATGRAKVVVMGNYVVLCVSNTPDILLRQAEKAIR